MNAIIAIIPILLIRYGVLGFINKDALKRAGFFAPLAGSEKVFYWVYQISTLLIFIDLLFLKIRTDASWFNPGIAVYGIGIVLYVLSIINYAMPNNNGVNMNGLYRISRNPMYVAYFICFFGCAVLTKSWTLLVLLAAFQISAHWIIISEERWCIEKFGEEYKKYMSKVRRYI